MWSKTNNNERARHEVKELTSSGLWYCKLRETLLNSTRTAFGRVGELLLLFGALAVQSTKIQLFFYVLYFHDCVVLDICTVFNMNLILN